MINIVVVGRMVEESKLNFGRRGGFSPIFECVGGAR
jgi:hypothetical protein